MAQIYTRLVGQILDHYFAEYGRNPDHIVLGSYVANEIAKESNSNLAIATEMIGSSYYFYDPQYLETFHGIHLSISYDKPFLVSMEYHIDTNLPQGADENTELFFKPNMNARED